MVPTSVNMKQISQSNDFKMFSPRCASKWNPMPLFAYTSIPLYNSFENKAMFCTQTEYYEILGSFFQNLLWNPKIIFSAGSNCTKLIACIACILCNVLFMTNTLISRLTDSKGFLRWSGPIIGLQSGFSIYHVQNLANYTCNAQ